MQWRDTSSLIFQHIKGNIFKKKKNCSYRRTCIIVESFTPEGQSYSYTVCGYSAARTASSSSEAVSSAQSKACTCTCFAHGYSFKTDLIYRCFLNWIETHSWTSQFGNGKCWTRCTINQKEKKKSKLLLDFFLFFSFFLFKYKHISLTWSIILEI